MKGYQVKKERGPSLFLVGSFIALTIITLLMFFLLSRYISGESNTALAKIGEEYMESLSDQISKHFQTTIDLRLNQVEAMVQDIGSTVDQGQFDLYQMKEKLRDSSKARGFEQLALLSESGEFEMLHGEGVHITDPPPYLESLRGHKSKVAVGTDDLGNAIILMGVPFQCPMKNGETSLALVGSVHTDYITETLSLEVDNSMVYSFIIRKDGSFVIRTSDAYRESYFDRVRNLYDDVGGRTPEEYIQELSAAMEAGETFSSEFVMQGERQRLFCNKLAYSEWYLLTVLPYGTINQSIDTLGYRLMVADFLCCGILLGILIIIFVRYYRMSQEQLKAVMVAQEAAEEALALAVDARREAEKAQRRAERATQAKSEFLSNMSHDIRTPMNAIVGMTAIATANMDNQQQVQNCLRKISTSSRHLLGLINDVLDMSKIESGKMSLTYDRVSLRELMESIVSIVQPQIKAKHQEFGVSILDITSENVLTDSVRLNQVLLNLLSNAVKFTPEKGHIQVTMKQEPSAKGENYVRVMLWVKDNGIGMAPEFMEHLFDSFAREDNARVHKTEGTGLGMAITKYIVDTMGGEIHVNSAQGEGTEFFLALDMEKAEATEADMVLPSWNMLVVDDDRTLCESTVSALRSIGLNAEWTLSGEEAIRKVEQHHKNQDDYQIILLDWKLPGMDGLATAHALRERMGENIPILLISAYDWSEIEEEARAAGVSGFIAKPLFKSTLFYGLRQYVQGGENAPEAEEAQTETEGSSLEGVRVLVAEDNELNWEIASELLSEYGLILDWAENGQLCVEMLERSEPGYYKAVLMDIRMPVMTGLEATRAIRQLSHPDHGLPIVAMTADAFSEDVQKCLDAGMNAHVAKPIDVREVLRLLEKFIAEQEAQER
ncbi:MAG: response regulator [Acutalibacter sp.]|nr:response regulator [Acutalibacter sp.]